MRVAVALQNGRWEITAVKLEHNHDLVPSPSLTKFFMNHRFMSDDEITLSKILQEIRIKPRKIMAIFRKLRGKFSNLFFDKTKIKNIKQADKKIVENTDIDKTMVFVKKLQLEQPGFFYTMRTTSDNRVRSIFWTDTKSRLNYSLYGDFISFDTTYSTNKYNMPFAPIVGIDGHGKNIVFGWALLENQTADTFSWLFNAFLEVMGGKKPSIIMTDQDAAMKKSIDEIFPDEFHRNCFWHVMRNAREKLAAFISTRKEEGMGSVLYNLVTQSVTEDEFEEGWTEMLRKYDASENTYLKQMYNTRKMWVPVFFKKVFCPFIWSTGRSESTNSNFKDYVMRKDTIETFLRQYELFQEEQIEIENRERYQSSVLVPVYSTMQPIERHAGAIYTRGMFLKFQLELYNSSVFSVEELEKNAKYEVVKVMDYKEPEFSRRSFVVEVDRSTQKFDCVCAKYDRDGILCCHVLRLFQQLGIHQIPETYINKRWTAQYKEAEMKKQKEISVQQTGTNSSQCALRYALMMNRISDMCSAMSRTNQKSKEFIDSVEEVFNKMNAKNDQQPNREVETQYKDPLVSTAKSVNKGSRLMRASEKKKGKRNGGNGSKSKALPQQPSNDAA